MVNFGGHVTSLATGGKKDFYLVPYNECKNTISAADSSDFENAWDTALNEATNDFQRALTDIWATVFAKLPADSDEIRGIPLGDALRKYVEHTRASFTLQEYDGSSDPALETVQILSACHTAVVANSEGLRKLVKKHDKKVDDAQRHLSTKLLPKLYASSFFTAEAMLADTIGTLRNSLDEPDNSFNPLKKFDSEIAHKKSLESRFEELEWLKRLAKSIPPDFIEALVAHRGFHHVGDRNDKRPLENSTASMEIAWTSGIPLCECDIALTKDEKLVLAHDESFQRLALDSNSPISNMRVSDLTFRELISLPLKSGLRPPLLIDVLRSAQAIADNARLIIEIKPGNPEVASALARLLIRHPELAPCVAMIMSFDAVCMHRLREELSAEFVNGGLVNPTPSRLNLVGAATMHRRLSSYDHFGTIGRGLSHLEDMGNLGLSLSQTNLDTGNMGPTGSPPLASPSQQRPSFLGQHNRAISIDELTASSTVNGGPRDSSQPFKMPELLLTTVCDPPQHPSELRVGIDNLSPIDSWLSGVKSTRLDGVYLQYQREMKTPEGAQALRELCSRMKVGVWMLADRDPDDFETLEWLVQECHVSYVNTDLPISFREGYSPRSSFAFDDE